MIVFAKADGTIMDVLPSPVYQGSNLENSIYFVAPFSRMNAVTVSFKLPNGINTQSYPMTSVSELEGVTDKLGKEYSVWQWAEANAEVTQYAGVCLAQFGVYLPNGQLLMTARTGFDVQAGILPDLPPQPAPDVYALILRYIQQLNDRTKDSIVTKIEKVPSTDNAFTYTDNKGLKSFPIVIGEGSDPPAYLMAAYMGEISKAAWEPIYADGSTTVTGYKAVIPAATHGQMQNGATIKDLWIEFGEVQNAETENPSVNDALEQYTIDAAGNITITVTQRMDLAVKVWNGKGIKGEKGDPSLTCVYAIDWDGGSNQFSATVSDFNRTPLVNEKFVSVLKVDNDNLSVGSCIVKSVTNNQLVTGTILQSYSIVGVQGLVYPYIYMTNNIGTVPYEISLQTTNFNRTPLSGEEFTLFVLLRVSFTSIEHYLAQAKVLSVNGATVVVNITYQSRIDGAQGPQGEKGEKGNGIAFSYVNYQIGDSGTKVPTGAWSVVVPEIPQGKYLWTKTVIQFENEEQNIAYSVSYRDLNFTQEERDDLAYIKSVVPSSATPENQLADKAFVNSTVNNMSAFYITSNAEGAAFATHAALIAATTFYSGGKERVPTQNDYATVLADETQPKGASGSYPTTRYVYQTATEGGTYPDGQWDFQYVVNNTSLTQAQVDAINSGITAEKITQIDNSLSGKVNKSGDTMTGNLGIQELYQDSTGKKVVDANAYVYDAGRRVYSPNNPPPTALIALFCHSISITSKYYDGAVIFATLYNSNPGSMDLSSFAAFLEGTYTIPERGFAVSGFLNDSGGVRPILSVYMQGGTIKVSTFRDNLDFPTSQFLDTVSRIL